MEPSTGARTIAVFRALKLGDLLCAVPALRAIREARPADDVVLIGLPWAESFAERLRHLIDAFVPFPGWPGMPESDATAESLDRWVEATRRRAFDLVIQMHGSGASSNAIVASLGARRTAGFTSRGAASLDLELPYPDELHEIHRHLALVERLGVVPAGDHLEFPVTDGDREALAALGLGLPRDYAVVHAGATSGQRWPPERFAAVADALAAELGVVLTGTDAERGATAAVAGRASSPVIDATGRTSLGSLAALIEGARFVLTNDTGVSHLTAAVGTPSVVLFLSSDPRRWAPLDAERHRAVVHPAVVSAHAAHAERAGALEEACLVGACRRHPDVRIADPSGLRLDVVLTAVRGLLADVAAGAVR